MTHPLPNRNKGYRIYSKNLSTKRLHFSKLAYGKRRSFTARFRGVVGNVRKHRICKEKVYLKSFYLVRGEIEYQVKCVFTKNNTKSMID